MGSVDNFHPSKESTPYHIGIIPDGGRRWAKQKNISLLESYNITKKNLSYFTKYLFSVGVMEISIYLSSAQNFRRNQEEVDAFSNSAESAFNEYIFSIADEFNVKVNIAGNPNLLSKNLRKKIQDIKQITGEQNKRTINLCIAYNPFDEIFQAFSISSDKTDFKDYLWVKTPIDLIIRSGGANLLSNFLPLQSGFARIYFFEKLFNDITLNDIKNVLEKFSLTDRKYGE
ncbi:MAG: di-trans,poly-cis-decaprenylcistransferase [Bacteroidales bacterium]|nr:di-trans,poly-cis-decaprenylcistransferase [Bacteroidales bacterium]